MKRELLLVFGVLFLFAVSMFAAQRHGGGNPGMQGGGAGNVGSAGQHGSSGQMGSGAGMGTQDRLRVHATDRQQQQLRDCTQSADRIRTRTRDMTRQSKKTAITPEQAKQWREQLRNEVQSMNRNHEQLMAGLTDEQKAASRQTIQEMNQTQTRLRELSEMLDKELVAPELQQDRIRDRARETERAADQLKRQQSQLTAQLNQ